MGDGYLHLSPSWILGKGGEKQDGESSPTRTDCKTRKRLQNREPQASYNQAAPELGPSANPCPPEPLPAFGVLWEGMVEAAWRGLLRLRQEEFLEPQLDLGAGDGTYRTGHS